MQIKKIFLYIRVFLYSIVLEEMCAFLAEAGCFNHNCLVPYKLLIEKGRGNGPVKPWQPVHLDKVPIPTRHLAGQIN